MKVGHLIHLDGPGGGPLAVIRLVKSLRLRGIEQVVFHGGADRIASTCDALGVPRVQLPIGRKSTLLPGFIRLVLALRRHRPDVLILQGQWAGPVGALAAALAKIKTVYVTQWPAFYTDWTPFRTWRNAWAEWIPCRFAQRVVAPAASVHYQYLHRGWVAESRLVVIPNMPEEGEPPGLEQDALQIRRENGWADDAVHVVSVGRLTDQKRVDWLLHAWKIVQARRPDARLWIVGDGAEAETLRSLANRLGIEGSCHFLGAKPKGIAYIAAADIVVMTTMYESFGYVAYEAMGCGKPLVATAADGVRDTVTNGVDGYLVPPGDAVALADRLVGLIADKGERSRLGAAGRVTFGRWDAGETAGRYLALLQDVAKDGPT